MKVLQVFKDYFPPTYGGIEQHINEVVHSSTGIQFSVLTSSRSRKFVVDDDDGVRIIRTPEYFRPVSTPITPKWSSLLRRSGADLLHFHMPNPFGELMYLTSRTPTPMIVSYQGDIVGRRALVPLFKPFQRKFLEHARLVVVSNPGMIDSPILSDFEEKCRIVPFGVDPNRWKARPIQSDEIRDRFDPPITLFVGRLAHYKGLDFLVEAMKSIEGSCLIVGDGPRRQEVETRIANAGLTNRVHLVGHLAESDKTSYYHAADLFVLPSTSRAESFGIVMLEAMACGVPVVSTELGTGTSWVNKHRSTGLVVQPGDAVVLAGAITTLLRDEDKRRQMGVAAAQRVREHFTKKNMLEGLRSVYLSAIG